MTPISPDEPLSKHFRLTPIQRTGLKKLRIASVRDLLYHFPVRYDQGGDDSVIGSATPGASVTVFGTIGSLKARKSWKRKIPVGEAVVKDASGSIKIMWFHQPYLVKKFSDGQFVKATGVVGGSSGKTYLANPHVEAADPAEAGLFAPAKPATLSRDLFAVYPETRGITSLWFRHAAKRLLERGALDAIPDPLPENILHKYHLPHLARALLYIHKPDTLAHALAARKRFSFEEIFAIQVARAKERAENDALSSFPVHEGAVLAKRFLGSTEVSPTSAQSRVIGEVLADFEKRKPMSRLLEGDVGSGKTLVAAATAYAIVNSRPPGRDSGTLQVAYMAPTEILAQQHFRSFIEYFRHLPIAIGLITGSGCKKFPSKMNRDDATNISPAQLLKWVAGGEIALVVGTHALIQKSVGFQNLAYVIVDEQHRFGTSQRRALARKSPIMPHFFSMTATPIPRTLALTLWGDLDISVLDELPPGRAKVTTSIVRRGEREAMYETVRRELRAGRQAYVICPRIEEADPAKIGALQATSVKSEAARLKKEVFQEYSIGLLHGAMRPAEKDAVMKKFASHEIDILVATSVVEVGVNVPNATVMVIEGAERFGLAQMHQLRGRVMRSSHPPHCFLVPDTAGEAALKRLRTLEKSDDGFALAEADLENRGMGDLYGKSQWGVSDLGMEALKNPRLIQAARTEARALVAADPSLAKNPALQKRAFLLSEDLHEE
ncbi:MAG: ATP-dependent DNA helicase RecG [Patescibacteria group bacterium]|nr:ATP-dependent DNA helicase RecG [Patescibacteria group bacterium]